jgi:hypothetical protein
MKPVLILQHLSADGPAYLGSWLEREGQPFDVFDSERGAAYRSARQLLRASPCSAAR